MVSRRLWFLCLMASVNIAPVLAFFDLLHDIARALGLPIRVFAEGRERFAFSNAACVELEWEQGARTALRWRRRAPEESAWATRDEEAARLLGGE